MNDWINHNAREGNTQPEKSRGLAHIDVVDMDGVQHDRVDPTREVMWGGIRKWRRSREEPAPKPVDGNNVQATLNERGKTHGDFAKQADTAQAIKVVMHAAIQEMNRSIAADQLEALHMIAGKISRILHGNPNEPDHWRDIAGYATLIENRLVHGRSHLG